MSRRLLASLTLAMSLSLQAHSQDGQADLKATADSGPVEEDLKGPDGCSVQLGDPANWKLVCLGTAAYDFNDADEIKDATREATLDAKAALARFLKEKLTTEESIEKVVTKQANQASGQGRSVSKNSMKTQVTTIKSSADAILRGVIVLESEQIWQGSVGTVRVKIGQSQKTMAVAGQFAAENAATGAAGRAAGPQGVEVPGPTHTTRKSGSDF